tara:strand:- start:270 stop:1241 length:972 start_codon:yes stop_codon:yes gene_type:complete
MFTEIIGLVAGIVLILGLAELIVKSSMKLARHYGLSGTFIGLTILSIGTSIPEIMSAVAGSLNIARDPSKLHSLSGLILGQNIGSDIFQQSFILALIGIIGTIIVVKKNLLKEVGALIAGAVLVWLFAFGGTIDRIEGFIMLAAYTGYLIYLARKRKHKRKLAMNHLSGERIALEIGAIIIAFIFMGLAASKVLDISTVLVKSLPISASFFGVILLGIASALPELTTSLVAVIKKEKGISAGVLIGSNITNPMMGLGLGALISTYAVPDVILYYDLPFKIGTALLILYFLHKHKDLRKWQGVVLILLFFAYLFVRMNLFPIDF